MRFVKKFFKRFYIFPLGIRRIFIAGILIFPFILMLPFFRDEDILIAGILFGIPIYIFLVLIIAWIYEGFKIDDN